MWTTMNQREMVQAAHTQIHKYRYDSDKNSILDKYSWIECFIDDIKRNYNHAEAEAKKKEEEEEKQRQFVNILRRNEQQKKMKPLI